jgi:hypothetical protein
MDSYRDKLKKELCTCKTESTRHDPNCPYYETIREQEILRNRKTEIAVLVQGLNEQRRRIDALVKRVAELEKKAEEKK